MTSHSSVGTAAAGTVRPSRALSEASDSAVAGLSQRTPMGQSSPPVVVLGATTHAHPLQLLLLSDHPCPSGENGF